MFYEDSINEYGIPLREATDPEMDGWYEVDDSTVDYAVQAMQEFRDDKNNKSEPGTIFKIVNTRVDEGERPEAARAPVRSKDEDLSTVAPGLPAEKAL